MNLNTAEKLQARLKTFCLEQGLDKTYWVAYSGGLDSHVLLSLCVQLRKEMDLKLQAIHINHQISQHALSWASHCQRICAAVDVPLLHHALLLPQNSALGVEGEAREKRYAFFAKCLAEGDILFTAHHQDDQAETLLLQLFRGAGPKGLAAMPLLKPLGKGFHARPFLSFPRSVLEGYAQENKLTWIEDEMNQDEKYNRNFIRHSVLPLLEKNWPSISQTLAKSAMHCAEMDTLLETVLLEKKNNLKGSRPNTLSITQLLSCSPAMQRAILRSFIKELNFLLPPESKIEAIRHHVLKASKDRQPLVKWKGAEVRRHRDDLFIMKPFIQGERLTMTWDLKEPLILTEIGRLSAKKEKGKGFALGRDEVTVKFRQGGERLYLQSRGHCSLKNLFQEWNVPVWLRNFIPLLFVNDELLGVVGYRFNEKFAANENEMGWSFGYTPLL